MVFSSKISQNDALRAGAKSSDRRQRRPLQYEVGHRESSLKYRSHKNGISESMWRRMPLAVSRFLFVFEAVFFEKTVTWILVSRAFQYSTDKLKENVEISVELKIISKVECHWQ